MSNKDEKRGGVPKLRFPEFREAGEWQRAQVAWLISTVTPPKKIPTSDYLSEGLFPIIDQGQSDIAGWTNDLDSVIEANLPLIVFGDHTCTLKLIRQSFAQGADGIKIIKGSGLADTAFLYQFLQFRPVKTEEYKRHFSILKTKAIAYPDPKSGEQQKIADCLASLDELITLEAQQLDALKTHKKGLMQQLFPAEGETLPKLRFPEFRDAGEWRKKKIGRALIEQPRPIDMDDEEEYSLVTVKRRYGGIVLRGVFKGRSIKVKTQFLLQENDFLISKRQIVHCACGVVSKELDGSIVSNEYSVLRARDGFDVSFFDYYTQQPSVSQSFLRCSVGIVIEKMLFKLNDWLKEDFLFPLLHEQQKIADCLASLDELIAVEGRKLDALKTHKKGLMQQLFPVLDEVSA